jgi:hypothetical protein
VAEAVIEISLGRLQQLFNSFDPSPFPDPRSRSRCRGVYSGGWAEEIALPRPLRLIIHLPPNQEAKADQLTLERTIHNYFAYQQQQGQRRLRLLFRDGRLALLVGVVFLLVCTLTRQLAYSFGSGARIVKITIGL